MNKILQVSLLQLTLIVCYCQKPTGFKFDNYSPNWYYLTFSDSIPKNIQGIEPEHSKNGGARVLINDNFIYPVYNIVGEYYNGYLVEKIDLNIGKKVWENFYFSTKLNERRYAQSPCISNGNLDLVLFTENSPKNPVLWPLWFNGNLNKLTLNLENGNVISATDNRPGDPLAKFIAMPEQYLLANVGAIRSFIDNDNFKYNYVTSSTLNDNSKVLMTRVQLSNKEHVLDSITIAKDIPYTRNSVLLRSIDKNKLITTIYCKSKKDSISALKYFITDRDFNITQEVDISQELEIADGHAIYYADTQYIIMATWNEKVYDSYKVNDIYKLDIFNLNGSRVNSLNLNGLVPYQLLPVVSISRIIENNNNKILLSYSYIKDNLSQFDFYIVEPNQKIRLAKHLQLENINHLASISEINQIGNNLICQFHFRDNSPGTLPMNLTQWVSIPLEDLKVKTQDLINNKKFVLFPNQAIDYLNYNIYSQSNLLHFLILDLKGNILIKKEVEDKIGNVYINHLVPGFYFFELEYSDGNRESQIFIKK